MKKLIELNVTAKVKLLNGKLGITTVNLKAARKYLVGERTTAKGYKKLAEETLAIKMAESYPKVMSYTLTGIRYKILNGVPKVRRRSVPLWIKDCRTGAVVKYDRIGDAALAIGMKKDTLSGGVSVATKTIRQSKFSKYYEVSLNGVDFTCSENPVLLNDSLGILRTNPNGGKKKPITVVTLITKEVTEYSSILSASKALKIDMSVITRLASNVAINRHNSNGKSAFWYTEEYIPGESVAKIKRKRDFMSIRIEAISVTDGKKTIHNTINTVLEKEHITYDTFIRNHLNRATPLNGFLFRTLGSSCEIPSLAA